MPRRLGLVVTCILGCGDNVAAPSLELIRGLSVERVATPSADDALGIAIGPLDERTFVIARADTRGGAFCPECVDHDPSQCPAICRRAAIEVAVYSTSGAVGPSRRVADVFPRTDQRAVGAVELVVLDRMHVGVAWLDCDNAPCAPQRAKQSCTASYRTIDLGSGSVGPIETLYEDRYGDLQLAFDPGGRRLLALVGTQRASSAGVRAAIYDQAAGRQLAPWTSFGGASARAPTAVATVGGFLIVADDPAPDRPPSPDPCAESCECTSAVPPELATGGLYAFRPGLDRPAERIAPGRGIDGAYGAREAIAAIDAGGRVIVASSQALDRSAELFEPVIGGWLRRHASRAPAPSWVGALGDGDHLAWLGTEPTGDGNLAQRLVAGVVTDDAEERGVVSLLAPGAVLEAAPVVTETGATRTFLLRGVLAPGEPEPAPRSSLGPGSLAWEQFEVLEVRADW